MTRVEENCYSMDWSGVFFFLLLEGNDTEDTERFLDDDWCRCDLNNNMTNVNTKHDKHMFCE